MNELQRMQYLDAVGVDMFVPRFVLPQAKTSAVCELPIAQAVDEPGQAQKAISGVASVTDIQGEVTPPAEVGGLIASLLDQSSPPYAKKTSPTPVPTQPEKGDVSTDGDSPHKVRIAIEEEQAKATEPDKPLAVESVIDEPKSEAVSFSISVWASNQWVVIDSQEKGQALPTDALLGNILLHTGNLTGALPRSEIYHWPPAETPKGLNSGWREAQDWILPFIEGKLAGGDKRLIVMGEAALKALLADGQDLEQQMYQTVPLADMDIEALLLPSLATILYSPLLKYKVWQAFRHYS